MSIAGGLHRAFEAGVAVGCDCLQIFVKNQRHWQGPALTDEAVARFREALAETGLSPVVAHAAYLINLAADNTEIAARSEAALVDELERCETLGIPHLILHPGSHGGAGYEEGIGRIVSALDGVHRHTRGFATRIALETTAGQGFSIGSRFADLRAILAGVSDPERLRVCLDTCHLFAAGYEVSHGDGYAATMAELDEQVGADRVVCIHMNDSRRGCGSRVDRHAHIGEGCIGVAGLKLFVSDPRWASVPKILETPKGTNDAGVDLDVVNLERLRSMVGVRPSRASTPKDGSYGGISA